MLARTRAALFAHYSFHFPLFNSWNFQFQSLTGTACAERSARTRWADLCSAYRSGVCASCDRAFSTPVGMRFNCATLVDIGAITAHARTNVPYFN